MDREEDPCNTGPDDETLIREKKRLRRVSFAENTEVHVFDRDEEEDGETPPQPPQSPPSSHQNPQLGQLNDNYENCYEDEEDNNNGFIREIDSSSPGSAVSSATSNDEDNFFGPVSASFIRLGRQDSAASDEHDITLDSTAFSMHFQSLAQSDSASNCKTPTPSFEGKNSIPTNSEGFMVMTRGKKPFTFAAVSGGDSSGGFDSSDMSLIRNNASDMFDYGRLSPTLDALLANGSASDQLSVSKSHSHLNSESSIALQPSKAIEPTDADTGDTPTDMAVDRNGKLLELTIGPPTTPTRESNNDYFISTVNSSLLYASTTLQNQILTDSIQKQGIHLVDLDLQEQYVKPANMEQRQESAASDNEANASADSANGSVNHKLRSVGDKGSRYQTTPKEYGSVGDFLTPLRRGALLLSPLGSSDLNFITRTDPTTIGGKFSGQNPLHKSASPHVRKTATARRLEKLLQEGVVRNSLQNENQVLSEGDRLHPFLRKGPLSYTKTHSSDACGHSSPQTHKSFQEMSPLQDFVSSGRKRRAENVEPIDENNIDGLGNKKSVVTFETGGSGSDFCMDHFHVGNDEIKKTGSCDSQGQWVNDLKELPAAIERLICPLLGKLNAWELGKLEEILGRMQKATKYEKLSSLVQFQRTHDPLANSHQERIEEAKWLQETLVYEQIKLLLLQTRQEQLRKKVELLQSGIQETQKLKSCLKNVLECGVQDAQKKDEHDKIITKREELGLLDTKVNNLTKSLLSSCKMKDEQSPDKCIVLMNDYLRRKMRCRLIQKELQVCQVNNTEREKLVLNYYNVLHQRLTINPNSFSKLSITNKLNNVDIVKRFPKMNATAAFAFVFNEATRNLVSNKSLAVQTQMTRSLLHSLLLVVGEVQVAGIELRNLVQTSFRSPCVGLLELQLCFVDFKTGDKLLLILDMTCLIRGVYPLEIQPQISLKQTTISSSSSAVLLNEIEAAVKALKLGHSIIYRLCNCVSQLLDRSS